MRTGDSSSKPEASAGIDVEADEAPRMSTARAVVWMVSQVASNTSRGRHYQRVWQIA